MHELTQNQQLLASHPVKGDEFEVENMLSVRTDYDNDDPRVTPAW